MSTYARRLGTEAFLSLVKRKAGAFKTDRRDRTRQKQKRDAMRDS